MTEIEEIAAALKIDATDTDAVFSAAAAYARDIMAKTLAESVCRDITIVSEMAKNRICATNGDASLPIITLLSDALAAFEQSRVAAQQEPLQ